MKKAMPKLAVSALLLASMFSVSNTYAADDFEALLNALSDGDTSTEQTVDNTATNDTTDTSSDGEVDLDSLSTTDTAPAPTQTYSSEATITEFEPEEDTTTVEYEPEEAPATTVDSTPTTTDTAASNFAPTNDNAKLTVTGLADSIYFLVFGFFVSGLLFIRNRKQKNS